MKPNSPASSAVLEQKISDPEIYGIRTNPNATPRKINPAHTWRKWVAFDHARILLPQFVFGKGRDPLAQIYRLSLEEGEPRIMAGAWARFWTRPIFALVVLRQMWIFFRRYGSFVKEKYGVSTSRQLQDLWYCAWHQNQSPRHYYWRKLYLIPNRATWLDNLEHRQVNTLLNHLNRNLPITKIIDKLQFYQHCLDHNLPTAGVLASWNAKGKLVTSVPESVAGDLFLKPTSEYGSVGIMPIVFQPATGLHRLKGVDLAWPDLLKAIGDLSRTDRRPMLIQRRLRNAPRTAIYGDSDICNVRVVTGLAPGGEPELIGGFVRLPSSLTTTGHDRNIMIASIDAKTGLLEPGRFRETMLGDFPIHPDTRVKIENEVFASWAEMVELALHGHRTCPWMPFVGWDVVDTTDGILLLEANAYWGGDCLQLPGAAPLGRTRFPEIYLKNFGHFYGPDSPAHRFPVQ